MYIPDTDLPMRAVNCLMRAGIETTEELSKMTDEEIIKIRNVGQREFDAIKKEKAKMNEIVDVEYKDVVSLEEKSTETLTAEANTIWNQMEMIGNLGIQLAIEAGERLNVIKGRLGHGEWEGWAKENLDFSLSKANRMMKLSAKASNENSLFSNPSTFTDIGISKVYALLATSEEVAEEVLENPEASDMSVRELKDEIKKLEAEKKEAERTSKDLQSQNFEIAEQKKELAQTIMEQDDKLNEYVKETLELKSELNRLKENPVVDESAMEDLERKLAEANDKLSAATQQLSLEKERVKKAEDIKDTAIEEAVKEATDSVKQKARAEAEEELARWKEKYSQLEKEMDAEVEKYQKKIKSNQNTELVEFKIKSDIMQKDFNDCVTAIDNVALQNPEQAEKMKGALKKLMEILSNKL